MPKPIAIKASDVFDKLPEKEKRAVLKRADEINMHVRLNELIETVNELRLAIAMLKGEIAGLHGALDAHLKPNAETRKAMRELTGDVYQRSRNAAEEQIATNKSRKRET